MCVKNSTYNGRDNEVWSPTNYTTWVVEYVFLSLSLPLPHDIIHLGPLLYAWGVPSCSSHQVSFAFVHEIVSTLGSLTFNILFFWGLCLLIGLVDGFIIGFGNLYFLVEKTSLDCDIETPIKDKSEKKNYKQRQAKRNVMGEKARSHGP